MQIILAADHGGFKNKEIISEWLSEQGHDVVDAGAFLFDPKDDFPDFVSTAVTLSQAEEEETKMIFWCRSGVGVDIAANRFPEIYCGFGYSVEQVIASTRDDHLNALALASDYVPLEKQKEMIEAFLGTPASEAARFERRLKKLEDYSAKVSCK
ncbi:MAG: RpiB/LacA/LacB family sugar-phosphate isomerase [Candidatus Moranbacteria bacterium]|nr:RpiB/LacA/LacB family sugar-phosphate isomerase [Candidatus Moranbacteria bacterium]